MKSFAFTAPSTLLHSLAATLAACLATWCGELRVAGQTMLSPVSVTESGLGTFSPTFAPLQAMIDHSGLNVPFESGTSDFDAYFAPPNTNFSKNLDRTKWQSQVSFTLPFGGFLDFDLGAPYAVSKVAIYNISVKSLRVLVAEAAGGPWVDHGVFSLTDQQSSLSLRATVLDLGGSYPAQFVRLAIESEFPAKFNGTYGYVILGEVVMRVGSTPPPTVSIALAPSGDAVVEFTGTLQSKATLDAIFSDVPGNPTSPYTIPKGTLDSTPQLWFRSRR